MKYLLALAKRSVVSLLFSLFFLISLYAAIVFFLVKLGENLLTGSDSSSLTDKLGHWTSRLYEIPEVLLGSREEALREQEAY